MISSYLDLGFLNKLDLLLRQVTLEFDVLLWMSKKLVKIVQICCCGRIFGYQSALNAVVFISPKSKLNKGYYKVNEILVYNNKKV